MNVKAIKGRECIFIRWSNICVHVFPISHTGLADRPQCAVYIGRVLLSSPPRHIGQSPHHVRIMPGGDKRGREPEGHLPNHKL